MFIELLKLTKNADPDKNKYSSYGLLFDSRSEFLFTDGSMGKNVIIFGANMSTSVPIDNKRNDILIIGEGPTLGLDDITLTAEAQLNKRFILSHTIMEAIASYLLMPQKRVNSNIQKTWNKRLYTVFR